MDSKDNNNNNNSTSSGFEAVLQKVKQFHIDKSGTFKYVQILGINPKTQQKLLFVRGIGGHVKYHKIVFQYFMDELQAQGCKIKNKLYLPKEKDAIGCFEVNVGSVEYRFQCLGGGRMGHDGASRRLVVYGYSKTYGTDHAVPHEDVIELAKHYLKYEPHNIIKGDKTY